MKPSADEVSHAGIQRLPERPRWRNYVFPWLWGAVLIAWTWLLLIPIPDSAKQLGGPDLTFWIGKGLHVGVYAFLTVLTWTLPIREAARWVIVIVLLGHGGLTEFLQQFVGRGSSWMDWCRDAGGIAMGTAIARGWLFVHRRRHSPQQPIEGDTSEKDDDAAHLG